MATLGFFPGCVLEAAAKEAKTSTIAVAKVLGMDLQEIDGWSCCGATHVQDIDETVALASNARNLSLAEKMGVTLVSGCSTCSMVLSGAKITLDNEEKRNQVNAILKKENIEYKGTAKVTHLLWEIMKEKTVLESKITKKLRNINVACFYGCHTVRSTCTPEEETYTPTMMEELITLLGASPVEYKSRLECCGFHAIFPAEKQVMKLDGKVADAAIKAGADCIVTPCPLCQMQLDMYQPAYLTSSSGKEIPIVYFTQLIGLALGCSVKELGLGRNLVSTDNLLRKIA